MSCTIQVQIQILNLATAVLMQLGMRLDAVEAAVAAAVAALLGEGVARDAPLLAAGLDSLAAVELRNDISRSALYTAALMSICHTQGDNRWL
jgi:Phosphopantetheine attachment site